MNDDIKEYFSGKRFNSISDYLKKEFGQKTIKLSIDGGFTCPNRDGSKGFGGCTFCSETGSGEFSSNIDDQIKLLSNKWPKAKYIAYFQNHTNTYADVKELRKKYYTILNNDKISGIAIATRPDCLNKEVLDLLSEINENHFMWIELGLQTIHDRTAKEINRCYDLAVFNQAIEELIKRNIKVVVHLILGLPGETKSDMLESVRYVSHICGLFGMKLHLLNVMKGSTLSITNPDYCPFNSIEEYVNLVVECLEIIPKEITIHKLTADAKRNLLLNPVWSFNKRTILNSINDRLNLLDTYQGKKS